MVRINHVQCYQLSFTKTSSYSLYIWPKSMGTSFSPAHTPSSHPDCIHQVPAALHVLQCQNIHKMNRWVYCHHNCAFLEHKKQLSCGIFHQQFSHHALCSPSKHFMTFKTKHNVHVCTG